MQRSLLVCFIAGVLLTAPGDVFAQVDATDKEPVVQGKPLSAWIEDLKDKDLKVRFKAGSALKQIGKPAIPSLVALLQDKDAQVRKASAQALALIGPAAREAAGPLAEAFQKEKDQETRTSMGLALGFIGAAPTPAMLALLKDEDWQVRIQGIHALRGMPPTEEGIKALLEVLKSDKNEDVGIRAAIALGIMGTTARDSLHEALKDRTAVVRVRAAYALGGIHPTEQATVQLLCAALADQEAEVRQAAAMALGSMAGRNRGRESPMDAAVKPLIAALKDEYRGVRGGSAEALGSMGPSARGAQDQLLELIQKDTSSIVRGKAAMALVQVGAEAKVLLGPLMKNLQDKDAFVRTGAVRALGEMGPAAKDALPALKELQNDPDEFVREDVEKALKKIDR